MGGLSSLPKRRGGAAPAALTHDFLFHFDDAGSPCANSGTLGGELPLTNFTLSGVVYKFGSKALTSKPNTAGAGSVSVAPTTGSLRGNWTAEWWFRSANDGLENDITVYKDANNQLVLANYLTSGVYIWSKVGGSVRVNVLQAVALTANVFAHIAVTYDGTNLRAFAAGTKIYEAAQAPTQFPDVDATYLLKFAAPSQATPVYWDEFAFSRTCKWTADFTPPTAAYSA